MKTEKLSEQVLELLKRHYPSYGLSLHDGGDLFFVVWDNPQENEKWLNSGYGEYYEEGEDAAMPVLAVDESDLSIYMLAPEEKYARVIFGECEENPGYVGKGIDSNGVLDEDKILKAFEDSIWNHE